MCVCVYHHTVEENRQEKAQLLSLVQVNEYKDTLYQYRKINVFDNTNTMVVTAGCVLSRQQSKL